MKKYLLLGVFVLMFASMATASTPVNRPIVKVNRTVPLQRVAMPQVGSEEMSVRTPGSPVVNKAPKRAASLTNWYNRPAGAFYVDMISVDGSYGYSYSSPFIFMKPFTTYTYRGHIIGADENTHTLWDIYDDDGNMLCDVMNAEVTYGIELSEVPKFYAIDGEIDDANSNWYVYQLGGGCHAINHGPYSSEPPVVESETPIQVFSVPSDMVISGKSDVDYWCSSKTTTYVEGPNNTHYRYTYYSGLKPAEGNNAGWWFGKNGNHVDGIAQAFEKPTSPYLLKKVGMYTTSLKLNGEQAKLTCKVYKLPEIPAYHDTEPVCLDDFFGEPIVYGEASITNHTIQDNYGFVEFTLYSHDEEDPSLTYDYIPTIDSPIIVVIEGYNDNADIQDFTASVSANFYDDEGYGELAYIKYPINIIHYDENGDTVWGEDGKPVYDFTGDYVWTGLNNFFSTGTMKTGLTIFLSTENPFITFKNSDETGEYTFPKEGGIMRKPDVIQGEIYPNDEIEGIDFYSWCGSEDYEMTWNGDEELPDWLDVKLEDVSGDEENGWYVHATVTAEPLPVNKKYREAVVRFGIPGDYIEYKFMQGGMIPPPHNPVPDVNLDGEVTIADLNYVINCILNGDEYYSIPDLNFIIEVIIGIRSWP
jgi:hypothetical protein